MAAAEGLCAHCPGQTASQVSVPQAEGTVGGIYRKGTIKSGAREAGLTCCVTLKGREWRALTPTALPACATKALSPSAHTAAMWPLSDSEARWDTHPPRGPVRKEEFLLGKRWGAHRGLGKSCSSTQRLGVLPGAWGLLLRGSLRA